MNTYVIHQNSRAVFPHADTLFILDTDQTIDEVREHLDEHLATAIPAVALPFYPGGAGVLENDLRDAAEALNRLAKHARGDDPRTHLATFLGEVYGAQQGINALANALANDNLR